VAHEFRLKKIDLETKKWTKKYKIKFVNMYENVEVIMLQKWWLDFKKNPTITNSIVLFKAEI
jgi:hypothetical protein